ncbi:hypothetical protein C1H46_026267 [Malus baccata]|uniref:Uncharacterized protein n=1 Tax=Malus baccata TaxID=106549 RepID=A0A540LNZ0_MALBA|nr:hypothetical protein C1H46_026267 [Malus baccata]
MSLGEYQYTDSDTWNNKITTPVHLKSANTLLPAFHEFHPIIPSHCPFPPPPSPPTLLPPVTAPRSEIAAIKFGRITDWGISVKESTSAW